MCTVHRARHRILYTPQTAPQPPHAAPLSHLGNHVAHQNHQVFVWDVRGALLELGNLVQEVGRFGVGQQVLRLPVHLRGPQQLEELCREGRDLKMGLGCREGGNKQTRASER